MFSVEVIKSGKTIFSAECANDACVLGRDNNAFFVLKGWMIGKQQIKLSMQKGDVFVEDGGGITGLFVNGKSINRYGPLHATDVIEIADYKIRAYAAESFAKPQKNESKLSGLAESNNADNPNQPKANPIQSGSQERGEVHLVDTASGIALRLRIHKKLIEMMDLRRVNVARMSDEELRQSVSTLIDEIITADSSFREFQGAREDLRDCVLNEVVGLGPLESLLADESVTEVMVNRYNDIFIEKNGKLMRSSISFSNDAAVLSAIERIVAPLGRRIDESSPMVDARLKDGSRVNAIIPPLAIKGPCITIRKFSRRRLHDADLLKFGSISREMLLFMRMSVEQRANVVISGGTGSGKTTLLNVLSNYIPDDERIVTVEDAAELQLNQPNLVSLEARPANIEGRGAVPIRDLVKNCLRMRPDRIVVGECRGGEALDMLQAMNTGHDGSLTTAHANTPRDCLSRLEVMALMSGLDIPISAIRDQVASAVDIIIQQTRFSCGSRRVTHISEVVGMEQGTIQLQDIFLFKQNGFGADGKIRGEYVATGHIPDFYHNLMERGLEVDISIFHNNTVKPVIKPEASAELNQEVRAVA